MIEKARSLQPVACEMLRSQFTRCGVDLAELCEDGHLFSRHFKSRRTAGSCQGRIFTLDTVTAGATAAAGHDPTPLPNASGDLATTTNLLGNTGLACNSGELMVPIAQLHAQVHPALAEQRHEYASHQQMDRHSLNDMSIGSRDAVIQSQPYNSSLEEWWPRADLDAFFGDPDGWGPLTSL